MKRTLILAAAVAAWAANQPSAFGSDPSFFARREYSGAGQLALTELNGAKIPDVLVCVGDGVGVLLGNGDGTLRQGPVSNVGMHGDFAVADMNGDGYADVVISGQLDLYNTWGVGVSFGNPGGTFQPAVFYPVADDGLGPVVVGDFNGDGIPDVVAVGEHGLWFFSGKGGGALNPGVLAPLTGLGGSMAAADFNQDGSLDLVIATIAGFDLLLGNGNGTFQPPQTFSAASGGEYIFAGDLTASPYPDVVLVPYDGGVYVYPNNGAGGFSKPSQVSIPGLGQIAIGDVNGDHIPDLVSSLGYIALGKGNGTFEPALHYPVATGPIDSYVVLGDLRNDGRTDIVISDSDGATISVLLNLGGAKFEDGLWTPVSAGAGCGAAARRRTTTATANRTWPSTALEESRSSWGRGPRRRPSKQGA